jgi:hypothetical protein
MNVVRKLSVAQQVIESAEKSGCLIIRQVPGDLMGYAYIGEAADVYYPLLDTNGKFGALSLAALHHKCSIEDIIGNYRVVIEHSSKIPFDGSVYTQRTTPYMGH